MALATQPLSDQVHSNGQPLILIQPGTLGCHDASGLKLHVEHITRILHHLDPPRVEQLPGDVTNSLKVLLPVWLLLVPDWFSAMGKPAMAGRCCSHNAVSVKCAILSTASSKSPPMTILVHGASGMMGINT
jgi:hypothetical protein